MVTSRTESDIKKPDEGTKPFNGNQVIVMATKNNVDEGDFI